MTLFITSLIVLGLIFNLLIFTIWASDEIHIIKARHINKQLYGNTFNECVLCPTCEGLVYISVWKKHIKNSHYPVHHIRPIQEDFDRARGVLGK